MASSQAQEPEVLNALRKLQQTQNDLLVAVQSLPERIATIGTHGRPEPDQALIGADSQTVTRELEGHAKASTEHQPEHGPVTAASGQASGFTSRIILTYVQSNSSENHLSAAFQLIPIGYTVPIQSRLAYIQ